MALMVGFLSLAFDSERGLVVWVVSLLFAGACVFEWSRMQELAAPGHGVILALALVAASAPAAAYFGGYELPGCWAFDADWAPLLSLFLALAVTLVLGLASRRARLSLLVFAALWICVPLPAVWSIWDGFGPKGLSALLILSKIGDILGYYFGSAMGKSHPFPNISPNKTTAGCVASLVGGTLAGGACVAGGLLPGGTSVLGILLGFLAGALVNIAAQAGDLLESRVKRAAKIKDSGSWFGPSGGALDLVDSLLFSVPAALCTWPWIFA